VDNNAPDKRARVVVVVVVAYTDYAHKDLAPCVHMEECCTSCVEVALDSRAHIVVVVVELETCRFL